MNEKDKIIANPSDLQIGSSIFFTFIYLIIAYYTYNAEWENNKQSDNTIILIVTIIICLFAVGSLYMLLSSKKVELTNEKLTISYPYIFRIKEIDINDIRKVKEDDYTMIYVQNYTKKDIYKGKKITLEFFESKKIVITSYEVTNYDLLASNLKNITKSYFKLKIENQNIKNSQNYGCIIFTVILILTIIIFAIEKNTK